jgi:hypothetical protein
VPIIFYTAHSNDNALQQEAARMSNAQVLQKPVPEQILLAAITGMLR